jgi:hypothetical protein
LFEEPAHSIQQFREIISDAQWIFSSYIIAHPTMRCLAANVNALAKAVQEDFSVLI